AVEQITYSGTYGRERGQDVLFVTERAVFRLAKGGLELIELAPGIDLEGDVLQTMAFRPAIARNMRPMDPRLFMPEKLDLARELALKPAPPRSPRLALLDQAAAIGLRR
ncbi:MAG TPA: 3-oxoacid CoA-transferase, partial [Casimicrobiaceae bacterium]